MLMMHNHEYIQIVSVIVIMQSLQRCGNFSIIIALWAVYTFP